MTRTPASPPRHVAIIMDGNGRWATARGLPRGAGHKKGVDTLRGIVSLCAARHIETLTVFAFSSENWQRPRQEVELLMELFLSALRNEVKALKENNIRLQFIGERAAFPARLVELIEASEAQTCDNTGMQLVIAANYGGRWDITRACRKIVEEVAAGRLDTAAIDEQAISQRLALADRPEPDLFIRTGGEQRLSNYLLWQAAYTELYFSAVLWPDFGEAELDAALDWFQSRQRRFGRTNEQIA